MESLSAVSGGKITTEKLRLACGFHGKVEKRLTTSDRRRKCPAAATVALDALVEFIWKCITQFGGTGVFKPTQDMRVCAAIPDILHLGTKHRLNHIAQFGIALWLLLDVAGVVAIGAASGTI